MPAPLSSHLAFVTSNLRLASPLWLLALLLIPAALWLRGRRAVPVLLVPFAALWHRPSAVSPSRWRAMLAGFALMLLAFALARPQRVEDRVIERTEGYDLVLCIDLSGSMLAEDFEKDGRRYNRLQTVKPVIESFIAQRPNDRIGVAVFGEHAYTLAPLTFDHAWLSAQVNRLRIGLVGPDRTAIGDGLGVALTRLEQSAREANGRRQGAFIVLLTDGENNSGALAPEQAANIAKSRGIPIYTIGAGRSGFVPMPNLDEAGRPTGSYRTVLSDLDERPLRAIAEQTGGGFFRADDTRTVEEAFKAINRAQKIEFEAKSHLVTTELFAWLAAPGLACMALAALGAGRPIEITAAVGSPNPPGSHEAFSPLPARLPLFVPALPQPPAIPPPLPTPKPDLWLVLGAIVVVGLNVWIGFRREMLASGVHSHAFGRALGQILGPGIIVLLFRIGKRFRNPRSSVQIMFWSSLLKLVGMLQG